MALDAPEKDDIIITVNEIQVAIDPMIEASTGDLILDVSGDGEGFSLLGNAGNCC
ncbi:hypothetical protein [Peribacillus sp. SCS-155]|uniref:hypothetical protein n=1 Tax=Peribacillus sedimenti TaxID=3115297 RepID=UPI003906C6CA